MSAPDGFDDAIPLSKRILTRLRNDAGTQRRHSLNRLEEACNALERSGSVITFESAGQECRQRFKMGPYPQSIRNDSGFKEYVLARKDEQTLDKNKAESTRKPELLARIEGLDDSVLRARLRLLYEENRETKRQLQQIQAGLTQLSPGLDIDEILRQYRAGGPITPNAPSGSAVDPVDIRALENLLSILTSETELRRHSLEYDGHRVQRSKPPFTPLIPSGVVEKLIALHSTLMGRPVDGHGKNGQTPGEAIIQREKAATELDAEEAGRSA